MKCLFLKLFLIAVFVLIQTQGTFAQAFHTTSPTGADCDVPCLKSAYCCAPNPNRLKSAIGCTVTCPSGYLCTEWGEQQPFCTEHKGICKAACTVSNGVCNVTDPSQNSFESCTNCVDANAMPISSGSGWVKDCECSFDLTKGCAWEGAQVGSGCQWGVCPAGTKEMDPGDPEHLRQHGPVPPQYQCTVIIPGEASRKTYRSCIDTVCGCWSCRNPMQTHGWDSCPPPEGYTLCGTFDPCAQTITSCPNSKACVKSGNNWTCSGVPTPKPSTANGKPAYIKQGGL